MVALARKLIAAHWHAARLYVALQAEADHAWLQQEATCQASEGHAVGIPRVDLKATAQGAGVLACA